MPLYEFRNTETGEITEKMLKMDEREQFLKDNPHLQQVLSAPKLAYSTVRAKPDDGFRDLLKNVHKGAGRNSKVNII